MLTNPYGDVGEFHLKFGLRAFEYGPDEEITQEMLEFRYKFLLEELEEFGESIHEKNHAEMFDALLDLVYVAVGTAHLLGYPWHEGWHMVQRANMTKERAFSADDPRSKRKNVLDVVKPEGWTPPDIAGLLAGHGYE